MQNNIGITDFKYMKLFLVTTTEFTLAKQMLPI